MTFDNLPLGSEGEHLIDLYTQWLDETCPAIRDEIKGKMAAIEGRMGMQ